MAHLKKVSFNRTPSQNHNFPTDTLVQQFPDAFLAVDTRQQSTLLERLSGWQMCNANLISDKNVNKMDRGYINVNIAVAVALVQRDQKKIAKCL